MVIHTPVKLIVELEFFLTMFLMIKIQIISFEKVMSVKIKVIVLKESSKNKFKREKN